LTVRSCLEITTVPNTSLDTGDAELAEMLQFVDDWLATDPGDLGASLGRFVGHPAMASTTSAATWPRFIFLLGGSDGAPLFQPGQR
jgi:hypothetical protein